MGFLIRSTFWFSLVLLALPLDAPQTAEGGKPVGPVEALIAASEAVTDIAGLCERKPDVCVTGRQAISTISVRAKEATRIAYETMNQPEDATGSIAPRSASPEPQELPSSEPIPTPAPRD
ncbi:MAG: DUF5330 domain-containing protein [Rhizobiales bacterium]|nr:DUF5330 domain-containing protein [Hyphomicrobiales bacterium]